MPLQIEILSIAEAEAIWKNRVRAENFAEYVSFLNGLKVGASFRVTIEKGEKNAASARAERHNFNEAAKERVLTLPPNADGSMPEPVSEPVLLHWKTESHLEKRVTKKDGKNVEIEVKVIDKLIALIVANEPVTVRGPRVQYETVVPENAPADATAGATVQLADGREAKLSKTGKWRAVKPKEQGANGAVPAGGDSSAETPEASRAAA